MDRVSADEAFRALVARYEDNGWDVRTIDAEHTRAIVRLAGQPPSCRKLWVDAAGSVQETKVPC